ncbi:U-box domain-containing protein kinase family protein [Rhynchospora pubera]|uniref:RING-type E3 ubiquitin transferase n=1 Tax=Rhynchospora pubera TaxID=906938 RepID=A0AAV8B477_9POAL|nr:U-box domain-containing protein kinase family protein [Rhynchospora pubera]
MNDIAQGLLALIDLHGITRLVMGAAADKHYSKKMKTPKSKKAIRIMEKADPFCKIWFVCKGALVSTREDPGILSAFPQTLAPSHHSKALSPQQGSHEEKARNPSQVHSSRPCLQRCNQFSASDLFPSRHDNLTRPEAVDLIYPWEGILKDKPSDLEHPVSTSDMKEMMRSSHQELDDDFQLLWPDTHLSEGLGMYADMYEKHKEVLNEIEAAKKEAFKESSKRRRAEFHLLSAIQKGVEEMLIQERQENDHLRSHIDDINKKLQEAEKRKIENEQQIYELEHDTKELQDKLLGLQPLIQSLKEENDSLQHERENALKKLEENMQATRKMVSTVPSDFSTNEFSYEELIAATRGFAEEMKIGEGGFGIVYRGLLRNTPVAVKVLDWDGMHQTSEFHQEVAMLSRIRHPNLVTLIGICPEAYALVYEYLPNGSLEDRLVCSINTQPLSWQARIRIIGEICSALMFLHSSQPHPVVHGVLKPDNILLDANLVSKISDFGICQMIIQSNNRTNSVYRTTKCKGTLGYMDLELIRAGQATSQSDVHSFGIIILRLLTGWHKLNISNRVKNAIQNENLHLVIDPLAGEWPFVQASQLAHLGIRCIELSKMKCADLATDVWQEIMKDPHIAADGFTYEAEAIRGWLSSGHDRSPMTNLKLENHELIPNRALRSAILEWVPQLNQ